MSALRSLSVLYLAAASSFAVAIALEQHPTLNRAAHTGAYYVGVGTKATAVALNEYVIQPSWSFTKTETAAAYRSAYNAINPPAVLKKPVVMAQVKHAAPAAKKIAPQKSQTMIAAVQPKKPDVVPQAATPDANTPTLRPPIADTAPPQEAKQPDRAVANNMAPDFTLVPQDSKPYAPQATVQGAPLIAKQAAPALNDRPPSQAQLAAVTQHLRDSLTKEMLDNFELFLFVSKADRGDAAQRMYVFQKQNSGDLVLLYNWAVSTGREKIEFAADGSKQPSFTPAGYYELDAQRMYVSHFSGQWRKPMPYAMFFNWQDHGYQTGLAIHGASGEDIGLLGSRASAGCVHLAPENARILFSLIKNDYKGLMPKFAYDKRTATMSNQGVLVHTTDGRLQMAEGYKVLVFIEDYGGSNVVAALF